MAKLVVNPSTAQKREVLLPRSVLSIGRDPTNDVVLPDAMVSRRHAVVEWRGGQFFIRDCNSSNGSLVNGDRISERGLRDGDLVAIGTARLLFRDDRVEEPGAKVVQHPSAPRLACTACGADYRKGDAFCRQCGASVAPPAPEKSVCTACGSAVQLPARYCNACGQPLPGTPEPASSPAADAGAALPAGSGGAAAVPSIASASRALEQRAEARAEEAEAKPAPVDEAYTFPKPLEPPKSGSPSAEEQRTSPMPRHGSTRPPAPAAGLQGRPRPVRPASAGARCFAFLVDGALIGVLQSLVIVPLALYWWGRSWPAAPQSLPLLPVLLSIAALVVALLLGLGYLVWGWGIAGATLGKRLLGLIVVGRDGEFPIGAGRALLRALGYLVSAAPIGFGFLLVALTGEGLHDKIAGTRVVRG